ncbi:MAG: DUF6075 family protein [Lachnotalea sp.]
MNYLDKEHERRFHNLMVKDNTCDSDKERQSLFYILAGNGDLYQKRNAIYDNKNHCIIPRQSLKEVKIDLSGGAKALVKLGFNLYNGMDQNESSVCDIFWSLDEQNRKLAINAIKLRFM